MIRDDAVGVPALGEIRRDIGSIRINEPAGDLIAAETMCPITLR
jgi:hypothetical protein